MTILKKFQGNYIEIVNALQLPPSFYEIQTREAYEAQIEKDLPRICYVNFGGNVQGMQRRLANNNHLKEDELSYTQGDFFAGIFTESKIASSYIYVPTLVKADDSKTKDHCYEQIQFTYIDDNGTLCGFSLAYLRDDSDLSILVEKRPLNYALAIIKDVNKHSPERNVVFFTHPIFMTNSDGSPIEGGQVIDSRCIINELVEALNSESIKQLLIPLFHSNGLINFPKFQNLDKRIETNLNIDDRDTKLNTLLDVYTIWLRLMMDNSKTQDKIKLLNELNNYMIGAFTEIDFFKHKSKEDIEALVLNYKAHPIVASLPSFDKALEDYAKKNGFIDFEAMQKKIHQSFLERNKGFLIVGLVLLALTSIALTLTGIFAPLGVLLGFGLGVAILSLGILCSLANNEDEFKQRKKEHTVSAATNYYGFMIVKKEEFVPELIEKESLINKCVNSLLQ